MAHKPDNLRLDPNLRTFKVSQVLPQYFAEDYPNLITFLEGYFEYLEYDDTVNSIQDMMTLYDLESTDLDNLELIFATIADGANATYFQDPREVLRNFANFYRVKGTRYSAEGFFRAFFGVDIEVEYPKNNIFIIDEPASQIGTESLHFIQDGALYQIFSVLIKSSIPLNTWRTLYTKFVHAAGFFLGGQVVLEIPSVNSNILTMPLSIEEPPPPTTLEGVAAYTFPPMLAEAIGRLPDDEDADTNIEYIDLTRILSIYQNFPVSSFRRHYGNLSIASHPNSPTFDDSYYEPTLGSGNTRDGAFRNLKFREIDSDKDRPEAKQSGAGRNQFITYYPDSAGDSAHYRIDWTSAITDPDFDVRSHVSAEAWDNTFPGTFYAQIVRDIIPYDEPARFEPARVVLKLRHDSGEGIVYVRPGTGLQSNPQQVDGTSWGLGYLAGDSFYIPIGYRQDLRQGGGPDSARLDVTVDSAYYSVGIRMDNAAERMDMNRWSLTIDSGLDSA